MVSLRASVRHSAGDVTDARYQAREEFRSRLLHLLVNGQTVGPAVEYVLSRTEVLRDLDRHDREVRWRVNDVYQEMFRRELNVLEMDNFPAGHVALLAARNKLALGDEC